MEQFPDELTDFDAPADGAEVFRVDPEALEEAVSRHPSGSRQNTIKETMVRFLPGTEISTEEDGTIVIRETN